MRTLLAVMVLVSLAGGVHAEAPINHRTQRPVLGDPEREPVRSELGGEPVRSLRFTVQPGLDQQPLRAVGFAVQPKLGDEPDAGATRGAAESAHDASGLVSAGTRRPLSARTMARAAMRYCRWLCIQVRNDTTLVSQLRVPGQSG
jgi:hypothetical protein